MRIAYRTLAYLIAAGVFVQAAAIAFAVFTIAHQIDAGSVLSSSSADNAGQVVHGVVGLMVIPALAIIFLIVSYFAKVPDGVTWAAIVFGLVALQIALAFVAFNAPIVGALHGMNALAIVWVAFRAASKVTPVPLSAADVAEAEGRSIIRRRSRSTSV